MYTGIQHAHSGLRWVVLILLIYAIYNAYTGWKGNRAFTDKDRKTNLFAMISVHLMLVLGLTLYFMGDWYKIDAEVMKTPALRFYAVEHISMMIVAIILITIGNAKSKRGAIALKKFKSTFWFYLIGLVIILAAIPWPPRHGAGWF